ncbi:MAG: hypothetical protein OXI87_07100 [Albidovulum sp.]|nr:hypothetical protein [Albidovulum sp.]MDE0530379.1 hypothetical protein [Albidovulum sp.]
MPHCIVEIGAVAGMELHVGVAFGVQLDTATQDFEDVLAGM